MVHKGHESLQYRSPCSTAPRRDKLRSTPSAVDSTAANFLIIRDLFCYPSPLFSNKSKQPQKLLLQFSHAITSYRWPIPSSPPKPSPTNTLYPFSKSNLSPTHYTQPVRLLLPSECVPQHLPSSPSSLSPPSPAPVRCPFKPTPSQHRCRISILPLLQAS